MFVKKIINILKYNTKSLKNKGLNFYRKHRLAIIQNQVEI